MVFGSHQLYTLVQQSQDKSIIAAQLVRAAKVQFKANDFEAGHKLLKQAVQVSPGSKEAMKLLVQMGVDTLQGIYPIWGSGYGNGLIRVSYDDSGAETYYFLTDREDILTFLDEIQINSLLSRAVVESSGEQRAKLLAHLAWLKLAKNTSDSTIDVEILFEDAIKAEEKNVYANTMIAAWFLSPYYQGKYEEDKMVLQSKAYEHFKVALQQTSNNKKLPHEKYYPRAWIRSIQRACLNGVDELKIVDEMWENGEPIVSTLGVTRGTFIALSGRGGAPYQGVVPELEKELISRFDTDHLLKLASWLAEKEYGCGSDGTCFKDAGHRHLKCFMR